MEKDRYPSSSSWTQARSWAGRFGIFTTLAGALLLAFAVSASQPFGDVAPAEAAPNKVFVCKYTGTPGVNEVLQTGDNPISVSGNTREVGTYFQDGQNRSYVLEADTGQEEPDPSECPPPGEIIDNDLTITTDIHNAAHTIVTSVPAGSIVHDTATVAKTASTPAATPAPSGAISFSFYTTLNCTGAATNPATSLATDGTTTAHSAVSSALTAGSYSYRASIAADANYPAKTSLCEPLAVLGVEVTVVVGVEVTTVPTNTRVPPTATPTNTRVPPTATRLTEPLGARTLPSAGSGGYLPAEDGPNWFGPIALMAFGVSLLLFARLGRRTS